MSKQLLFGTICALAVLFTASTASAFSCPAGYTKVHTKRFNNGPKKRLIFNRGKAAGRPTLTCVKSFRPISVRRNFKCRNRAHDFESTKIFNNNGTKGRIIGSNAVTRGGERRTCLHFVKPKKTAALGCPRGFSHERTRIFNGGPKKRLILNKRKAAGSPTRTCVKTVRPTLSRNGGVSCPRGYDQELATIINSEKAKRRLVTNKYVTLSKKRRVCFKFQRPR